MHLSGIQCLRFVPAKSLDSRFRGNDDQRHIWFRSRAALHIYFFLSTIISHANSTALIHADQALSVSKWLILNATAAAPALTVRIARMNPLPMREILASPSTMSFEVISTRVSPRPVVTRKSVSIFGSCTADRAQRAAC